VQVIDFKDVNSYCKCSDHERKNYLESYILIFA